MEPNNIEMNDIKKCPCCGAYAEFLCLFEIREIEKKEGGIEPALVLRGRIQCIVCGLALEQESYNVTFRRIGETLWLRNVIASVVNTRAYLVEQWNKRTGE